MHVAQPHLDPGEKIEVVKVSLNRFLDTVTSTWESTVSELVEIKLDRKKKAKFYKTLFS